MRTKTTDCLVEARQVFKVNYSDKDFKVFGPFECSVDEVVEAGKSNVYLNAYKAILDVLNHFGDLIHNLQLNFAEISMEQYKEFVKIVNSKSVASLQKVELKFCKANVLNDFTNIFESVTSLTFSSSLLDRFDGCEGQTLNILFPNVKHLYVKHTKASDWPFIDGNFPNLTLFEVELPEVNEHNDVNETYVSSFLKNNSHIDTLSIQHANLKLLMEVKDNLHKLRTLKIDQLSQNYLDYQGDTIHFNEVRKLTIKSGRKEKFPEKIVFDQLEVLILYIEPEFTEKWIEFIRKQTNTKLKTFTLYARSLANEQLLNISNELPNLEVAVVSVTNKMTLVADDIVHFIGKSKALKELNMNIQMTEDEQNKLKKTMGNDWNVEFEQSSENKFKIVKKR